MENTAKNYLKLLFCFILLPCLTVNEALAQREVMFAHYLYNKMEINPAYVGSRPSLSITALNRSHWTMVFENAPITQSLNLHSPANNQDVGLGMSFRNERFGPEKTTSFYSDFSYRVRLSRESSIRFGLKAGVSMFTVPLTELVIDDPGDPAFASDFQSHWLPNFGFGIYFRHPKIYAGFSIPKFLEVNYFDNAMTGGARTILQERNYYFMAGGIIDLNPDVFLRPVSYVRIQRDAPWEVGISVECMFAERFSLGLMVRLQESIGVLVGLKVSENLTAGYSFDWSVLNKVPSFNFGSHEIVLRYDLMFLESHSRRGPLYF